MLFSVPAEAAPCLVGQGKFCNFTELLECQQQRLFILFSDSDAIFSP
jgi:hypothetical protein